MRFPVSNRVRYLFLLLGSLLIAACKLSKDEEVRTTLSFTALYDSLKQYDSVVITLKDPQDGHTIDVAFQGRVRVPGDLEKRETPHWDGGKVTVAIEAYDAAGKLVYRLESSFDGRSNRRDSTYIFLRPGMGLSYPSDRLILVAGDSLPFPPVAIAPADLADKRILWTSSAPDVVEIGSSSLRPVKGGNAQVTARMAADTSKSIVFRATVYDRMELPEELSLSADTLHLIAQGAPGRLNISVIPSGAGKDAEWSIDKTSIASVTEDGIVQGLKAGAAWVRVRSLLRPALGDSAVVRVSDPVPPERVVFSGEAAELYVGGASESLMVSVLPPRAGQQVEFLVSPGTVLREENGRIRGLSAGEAQVVARSMENGSLTDTLKVRVLPAQRVESVTLGRKTLLLYTGGEDIVMTASVEPSGFEQKVQWRSGNAAIAKVDGSGRVAGVSPGRARIYAISRADSTRMDSAEAVVRTDTPRLSVGRADTAVAAGSEVAILPNVAPQEYGVVTAFKWDVDGTPGWDDSSVSIKTIVVKCDREKVYDFRFYVRDTEGNETIVGKKVTSVSGPVVNILSPRNGASLNTPELEISWTLDGVAQTTGTDTVLKEGANVITRSARDGAGKVFSAAVTVYLDTTPPAKPRVRGGGGTPSAFPTWTWAPGGGGSGAYRVALDTAAFGTGEIEDTVFTPATALADGVHLLHVQERDAAGNWSPSGQAAFTVDATGPAEPVVGINVTSPTNQRRPVWTWTSGGGGGSGRFQSRLGNAGYPAGSSADTVYFPPADLPEGTHVLYVRERDSLGNWSAPGSASVTVDTTPPASPKVYGTSPTNLAPRWSWTSGGGAGVFRYKVDGPPAGAPESGDTAYTLASPVTKTTYTLSVQERDAAGNWSPPASLAITYDVSKPMVAFTAPQASGLYLTRSATVDLAGTAGSPQGSAAAIRSVAYAVDGVAGTRTLDFDGAKWTLKALPLVNDKTLRVTVTALDGAGNSGEASLDILMDSTAPAAPVFTEQPPAVVNKSDSRTSLEWVWGRTGAASDSFVVKLNGKEVARQTETGYTVNGFADGSYKLEVAEKDLAGNISMFTKPATVLVDRVSPSIPLLSGPSKRTANPIWTWVSQVNSGGSGVFRYRLQAGNFSPESQANTFALPSTGYPDNQYTLGVQERDSADNWSEEAHFTITLDRTPPVIKILTPDDGFVTNQPFVTVTYTVQDGNTNTSVQETKGLALDNGQENVIKVSSDADEAGNIGTATLNVYRYSNVLFVRKGSLPRGNGSSWDEAFDDLQMALDTNKILPAGTQIWVSAGTYVTGAYSGASFLLQPNIGLYGGFAPSGYPHGLESRSGTDQTILIGNPIDGGYVLDGNAGFRSKVENVVVDGFSVNGGRFGIALNSMNSNFRINNCIFSGFGTNGIQGTIPLLLNGDGVFIECIISGNQNLEEAAAQLIGGRFVFDKCEFKNNKGGSFAGGLKITSGTHSLRNCIISGNTAKNSEAGYAQEIMVESGILDISNTKIEGGKLGIETWPWTGAELIWGAGNGDP